MAVPRLREGGNEHHPNVDRPRWLDRSAAVGPAYGAKRRAGRLRPAFAPAFSSARSAIAAGPFSPGLA